MILVIFEFISVVFGILSISMLIAFLIIRCIGLFGIDATHPYFRTFVITMLGFILIFLTSSIITTIINIIERIISS